MRFIEFLYEHHTEALDIFFENITRLGDKGIFWIGVGVLFVILAKEKKTGACMLIALVLGFIFGNLILKNVVMRSRPFWENEALKLIISSPHDYSFPSGHTLASFGAAIAAFKNKRSLGKGFLILAALIGFSRLYLSVHYPTDVIAGMAMGIFFGNISPIIYDKVICERVKSFFSRIKDKE